MTSLFICNSRPKHPASSWQSWSGKCARPADKCMCRMSCKKTQKCMTHQQCMG